MSDLEKRLQEDLLYYLGLMGERPAIMPDAPDCEEKWKSIAEAYLPDGVREYSQYPTVSLGWPMYIGMAVAKFWDEDWNVYGQMNNLYTFMRGKRGYDELDEYVLEEVLLLEGEARKRTEKIVAECASRTHSMLCHSRIEPGTPQAFHAYVSSIHTLYRVGVALQLERMGYKMTKIE
ncbi:MAG: hypothetical protein HUK02_05145 [Bacteroidaceae bacterium]|nr:hypothetical protein [Bacteroidaceae bacterium]